MVGTLKLKLKPTLGEAPIAFDGCAADAERIRDFGFGEANEEFQFDDAGLAGIDLLEALERLVNGDDVGVGMSGGGSILQGGLSSASTAPFSQTGTGMVDENAPHDSGGEGEEVAAILDFDGGLAEEADIEFVDEGSGLQGVVLTLAHQGAAGENAQLVIELLDEGVACG